MPGLGKCFFEIPIYRCDQDRHTKETEEERNSFIAKRLQSAPELPQEINNQLRTHAKNDYNVHLWFPWRYNEIVGWIRLCGDRTRIEGELWHIKAKTIRRRLVKKEFRYIPMKIIELNVRSNDSSKVIFNKISAELEQLNRMRFLKKRYIDLDLFKTIGPFIAWRQLLAG